MTSKALPPGLLSLSRPRGRSGLAGMLRDGELGFWASGVSLPHLPIQLALCSPALPCHLRSILTSQDVPSASCCATVLTEQRYSSVPRGWWRPQQVHHSVCACVLSCFSLVQHFVTLWTVACQAPPSMGFSRQEYWSGVPLPSLD